MEYNENDFRVIPDEHFHKFENVNDTLIGTLVKVTYYIDRGADPQKPQQTPSYKFCFLTKDGSLELFSKPVESFIVKNKLSTVSLGDVVKLVFTARVPIPNTIYKRKEFTVATLPVKNTEWLKANAEKLPTLDQRYTASPATGTFGSKVLGKALTAQAEPTCPSEDEISVEEIEQYAK